jgi:hypothetical protein
MRADRLRLYLILVLTVAAVISVVGKKVDSPFVGWISFAVFIGALFLYAAWRRPAAAERRASVFDRESKTPDETRTRPDQ